MFDFWEPKMEDGTWVREIISASGLKGSDVSFANLFLLKEKYDIKIYGYKNFLVRKYHGTGSREGYTFPIGKGNLKDALTEVLEDAHALGEKAAFILMTEEQKNQLAATFPEQFQFGSNRDDSDYVYSCAELANLAGKEFHRKKNHVSKFCRTYPNWEYRELGPGNLEDLLTVEENWMETHSENLDLSARKEYEAIRNATLHFEELELIGGVVYADQRPVAVTVASYINPETADVHFEKCMDEYAANGGYAVINMAFAKSQMEKGIQWLNREEDIGIEGLRKAKQSYRPKMMIKKYWAKEV